MEQSMGRFTKVGIILHVSYPQLGRGDGPILECPERVCGDGYFEAVEVARMKGPQVRKQAAGMIRMAHMVSAYDNQFRILSAELNISDLNETKRAMAVGTLGEDIDEAYETGCAGFSFPFGRYEEERKGQAFEQLLRPTGELRRHTEKKGRMSVCYEVFDYDTNERTLTDPAVLAAHYAGEIRKEHGNFGLLVDLSRIPMIRETTEESILPVRDHITHAHMGNMATKSPNCEAYGDNHPRFGSPNSGNDMEGLARYLRTLKEIGFLGEKNRSAVSFEVKPWKDESPEVAIANAERTPNLAWELTQQGPDDTGPVFDIDIFGNKWN